MDYLSFLGHLLRGVLTRWVTLVSFGLAVVALIVGIVSSVTMPGILYVSLIAFGLLGGFTGQAWEDYQRLKAYATKARPELAIELMSEPVGAWLPTRADFKTAQGGATLKEFVSLHQLSRWIHAKVENKGQATAQNCKGMLMHV